MRQWPAGGEGLGDLRFREALSAYRQIHLKRALSVYSTSPALSNSPGSVSSVFSGVSHDGKR